MPQGEVGSYHLVHNQGNHSCSVHSSQGKVTEGFQDLAIHGQQSFYLFIYLFCGTKIWPQGLCLEPLHQPFCHGFFQVRVLRTICLDWLWSLSSWISASWVARITGVSHRPPAYFILPFLFFWHSASLCSSGWPWTCGPLASVSQVPGL
jgi:hypothetical protein